MWFRLEQLGLTFFSGFDYAAVVKSVNTLGICFLNWLASMFVLHFCICLWLVVCICIYVYLKMGIR